MLGYVFYVLSNFLWVFLFWNRKDIWFWKKYDWPIKIFLYLDLALIYPFFFNFRMVCSYLVHHGYVGAAEAFAKSTGQEIDEDWTNIRNR